MSDEARQPTQFDVEAYRRFIGQIELRDIWLAGFKVDNRWGPSTPDKTNVLIDDRPSWQSIPGGFRSSVRYRVRFKSGNLIQATIEATYAVDFASAAPMTDELFEAFAANNLPLNTWPYLRALVADTLGRMGWLPFTLPAFKINVVESSDDRPPKAKPRRRSSEPADADVPF